MNINELTNDEAREAMREAIDEIGLEGAVSLTWHLLDKQAEKVTSDIAGDKAKTRAELTVMRMMLDKLESYYQEEMDIANGGDEPVYKA